MRGRHRNGPRERSPSSIVLRGGRSTNLSARALKAQNRLALIQQSQFYLGFETRDDVAEFLEVERFANNLVDCQFLICPDVVGRKMGRKDNDSPVKVALSKFPHQFQAPGARHPVIGDYHIEFLLCDFGKRVIAVFGDNNFSMRRLQRVGDGFANGWFVVDCENMEFLSHAEITRAVSRPNTDGFSQF